jgi:hypothetical protein
MKAVGKKGNTGIKKPYEEWLENADLIEKLKSDIE